MSEPTSEVVEEEDSFDFDLQEFLRKQFSAPTKVKVDYSRVLARKLDESSEFMKRIQAIQSAVQKNDSVQAVLTKIFPPAKIKQLKSYISGEVRMRDRCSVTQLNPNQESVMALAMLRAANKLLTPGLLVKHTTGLGKTVIATAILIAFWNKHVPFEEVAEDEPIQVGNYVVLKSDHSKYGRVEVVDGERITARFVTKNLSNASTKDILRSDAVRVRFWNLMLASTLKNQRDNNIDKLVSNIEKYFYWARDLQGLPFLSREFYDALNPGVSYRAYLTNLVEERFRAGFDDCFLEQKSRLTTDGQRDAHDRILARRALGRKGMGLQYYGRLGFDLRSNLPRKDQEELLSESIDLFTDEFERRLESQSQLNLDSEQTKEIVQAAHDLYEDAVLKRGTLTFADRKRPDFDERLQRAVCRVLGVEFERLIPSGRSRGFVASAGGNRVFESDPSKLNIILTGPFKNLWLRSAGFDNRMSQSEIQKWSAVYLTRIDDKLRSDFSYEILKQQADVQHALDRVDEPVRSSIANVFAAKRGEDMKKIRKDLDKLLSGISDDPLVRASVIDILSSYALQNAPEHIAFSSQNVFQQLPDEFEPERATEFGKPKNNSGGTEEGIDDEEEFDADFLAFVEDDVPEITSHSILRGSRLENSVFILDEVQLLVRPPSGERTSDFLALVRALTSFRDHRSTWVVGLSATPGYDDESVKDVLGIIKGAKVRSSSLESFENMISYADFSSDVSAFPKVSVDLVCTPVTEDYFDDHYEKSIRTTVSMLDRQPPMSASVREAVRLAKEQMNPESKRYLTKFARLSAYATMAPGGAGEDDDEVVANTAVTEENAVRERGLFLEGAVDDREFEDEEYVGEEEEGGAGAGNRQVRRGIRIPRTATFVRPSVEEGEELSALEFVPIPLGNGRKIVPSPKVERVVRDLIRGVSQMREGVRVLKKFPGKHYVYTSDVRTLGMIAYYLETFLPGMKMYRGEPRSVLSQTRKAFYAYADPKNSRWFPNHTLPEFLSHTEEATVRQVFLGAGVTSEDEIEENDRLDTIVEWTEDVGELRDQFDKARVQNPRTGARVELVRRLNRRMVVGRMKKMMEDPKFNTNGEHVPIILATSESYKGVDFLGVTNLYLVDSFRSFQDFLQFLGRGPRFCSHAGLVDAKQRVKMRVYHLTGPEEEDYSTFFSDAVYWKQGLETYLSFWGRMNRAFADAAYDHRIFHDLYHKQIEEFRATIAKLFCGGSANSVPTAVQKLKQVEKLKVGDYVKVVRPEPRSFWYGNVREFLADEKVVVQFEDKYRGHKNSAFQDAEGEPTKEYADFLKSHAPSAPFVLELPKKDVQFTREYSSSERNVDLPEELADRVRTATMEHVRYFYANLSENKIDQYLNLKKALEGKDLAVFLDKFRVVPRAEKEKKTDKTKKEYVVSILFDEFMSTFESALGEEAGDIYSGRKKNIMIKFNQQTNTFLIEIAHSFFKTEHARDDVVQKYLPAGPIVWNEDHTNFHLDLAGVPSTQSSIEERAIYAIHHKQAGSSSKKPKLPKNVGEDAVDDVGDIFGAPEDDEGGTGGVGGAGSGGGGSLHDDFSVHFGGGRRSIRHRRLRLDHLFGLR